MTFLLGFGLFAAGTCFGALLMGLLVGRQGGEAPPYWTGHRDGYLAGRYDGRREAWAGEVDVQELERIWRVS